MQTYDAYGRAQYNPDIHDMHGKRWSKDDVDYLIDRYYKDGPTEISFALGRPLTSIQTKANHLRRAGLLKMPAKRIYFKRMHATN